MSTDFMTDVVERTVVDRVPAVTPPLPMVFCAFFVLLAVISVVSMPASLARVPDGSARLSLLLWTGVVAALASAVVVALRIDQLRFEFAIAPWIAALLLPIAAVLV